MQVSIIHYVNLDVINSAEVVFFFGWTVVYRSQYQRPQFPPKLSIWLDVFDEWLLTKIHILSKKHQTNKPPKQYSYLPFD